MRKIQGVFLEQMMKAGTIITSLLSMFFGYLFIYMDHRINSDPNNSRTYMFFILGGMLMLAGLANLRNLRK